VSVDSGLMLDLEGVPDRGEQLALLGDRRPVRVPADLWRQWLSDPVVVARFEAKRYRRSPQTCWPFIGAISSTGHGSFRAGNIGLERRGTVPAHLFAYQLEYDVIPRLGWAATDDVTVCHQCDYAACTNPRHMRLGTNGTNRIEYLRRRRNFNSPLADVRGSAGRSRAIAEAVRAGLRNGDSAARIEARIRAAEDAGTPLALW
jgi:hypothetical protein